MKKSGNNNPVKLVGCCGAYCKTCKVFIEKTCKSCKLGYDEGERDINKVKCAMKVCCFRDKKLETCADCKDYPQCEIIHNLYNKNGYKYKKYKETVEFIIKNGYPAFFKFADKWNCAYGRLKSIV